MKFKYRLRTVWSVTCFWIFFSTTIAILSTFTFVQVDWLIRKERSIVKVNQRSVTPEVGNLAIHKKTENTGASLAFAEYILHLKKDTALEEILRLNELQNNYQKRDNISESLDSDSHTVNSKRSGIICQSNAALNHTAAAVSFGILGLCSNLYEFLNCELYNEGCQSMSSVWSVVAVVGGFGCIGMCICAVMSILSVALPTSILRYQVAKIVGQAQTVSVVLVFISVLGFPLGFGSDMVQLYCGTNAGPYNVGDCEIGWAFALLIVCASLSLYCPVLVHLTANSMTDVLPKYL